MEESIAGFLDRRWAANCLVATAIRLREQSLAAKTRARRRLFETLYLSVVCDWSSEQIAGRFELDRTTVVHLQRMARTQFMVLLQEISGVYDSDELRAMLTANVDQLKSALMKAHKAKRTS